MAGPASAATFRVPLLDDTQQRLNYKTAVALAAGLGLNGTDWITDTAAHTGDWFIIHFTEDSTISSITYKPGTVTGSASGRTLKAGDRIYGNIIGVQLASGAAEAYRTP